MKKEPEKRQLLAVVDSLIGLIEVWLVVARPGSYFRDHPHEELMMWTLQPRDKQKRKAAQKRIKKRKARR